MPAGSERERVIAAVAHEVDELVAGYRVQPWQERPCRIPGMPLVVQAYEYLLDQIFSLMRTEAHANETPLRTPSPPASKPAGRRGITPAFGYSAPHPSAGETLTLLIHALPSAHYGLC
jgi:hypothetical protein